MDYDANVEKELREKLKAIRESKKVMKEAEKKEDEKLYAFINSNYDSMRKQFEPSQISRIAFNLKKKAVDETNQEKGTTAKKPTKKK